MTKRAPIFLRYQRRWLADKPQSRVRIAEKSRRIGWSWAAAGEAVLEAGAREGNDVWYVGYNKAMAEEFVRDCAWWARKFNKVVGLVVGIEEGSIFEGENGDREIKIFAIKFASGYRITALSSRPTNLRGKKGHIIIDEAAFHDDLEGLLKSALAVKMWGGSGRVDIISTHNGADSYFARLVEEVRAKKRPFSLHRCTLDDALEAGLFKRMCELNKEEWSPAAEAAWRADLFATYGDDAEEELLCVPARSGGTYISRDLVERAMKGGAVRRLTAPPGFGQHTETARQGAVLQWCKQNLDPLLAALPKNFMHFFGEDFGRTSDRTVIAPGYIDQQLVRVHPFTVEMLNVPYDQQRQVLFYIVDRLPRFVKGALDATGNGGYLAEAAQQKYGEAQIECVMLSEKWYSENLPPWKAAFEEQKVIYPSDADHLLDISHVKVINGLPKLPKAKSENASGVGPPRHGDAAIAYALAHYASRLPNVTYEYTPVMKNKGVGFNSRRGVL